MRRLGDLDSNCLVAARPYCNGRATAFNKVLTRTKPIICEAEQKRASRSKASLVGFHCPDSGTIPLRGKSQVPNPRLQANFKSKLQRKRRSEPLKFGSWSRPRGIGIWNLGRGISVGATLAIATALRTPVPRDSRASTNLRALPLFAGSRRDRSPSRRVSL